ncbi:MAG: hypothetical protein D6812_07185, partial [Deltaproteobacteria bacterium]
MDLRLSKLRQVRTEEGGPLLQDKALRSYSIDPETVDAGLLETEVLYRGEDLEIMDRDSDLD